MEHNSFTQVVAGTAFFILALVFLNPFHALMIDMLHMVLLGLLVAVLGIFSIFIVKEKEGDEREEAHKMLSGRTAFLAGAGVLLLGVVYQAFTGIVDPWLIAGLCAMVGAKVVTRLYCQYRR